MALAGFTAGQADALRRAMSRKRSEEAMMALWEQFRQGAESKGVEPEIAQTVFRKLMDFQLRLPEEGTRPRSRSWPTSRAG